jgi:restriction-modification enzyme MmeI-like protein
MPNLSWNEIHQRAVLFARDWSSATREQADKQTFWNEFFLVFGIPRRTVASFEEPVRRLRGTYGFIDLLWKGKLLVEHKTAGASLEAAETQAFDYIQDLQTVGRGDEIPRYILLSDFQRFALYDLEPDEQLDLPLFRARRIQRTEFPLAELPERIRDFAFIPGYKVHTSAPPDQLNLKAVAIMASLHDTLKAGGYTGHDLERFLVRVLFCLFAENTHIFEPESFKLYIENRTPPDGNDLGRALAELFETLNTEVLHRQRNLDEDLQAFPYINGALFAEHLQFAAFNGPMRKALLEAANFDWSRISPAIFGALFQEVMNDKERRKIGAHYTSERDILKVIHPLFLDSLRAEFGSIQRDRSGRRDNRLEEFRVRLTRLKFLDPACGCGNFLVIAYRELRALELEVLQAQHSGQQAFTLDEVSRLSQVDVHQFYGIEIEEWPVRIAEVALWLMDHQSNLRILAAFSQPFLRLPLRNSPHIHYGNALRMDWNDLLPAEECSYILGNPPFIGKAYMNAEQKGDMNIVYRQLGGVSGGGVLDYVAAWYFKAGAYVGTAEIPICFVSTNSITQGEQPAIIWSILSDRFGLAIQFAYRTFPWESEARGKAHVHVIIMGLTNRNESPKYLFDRDAAGSQTHSVHPSLTPYLLPGTNGALKKRTMPISEVPEVIWGSMPNDGGHLLLSAGERALLLARNPGAAAFLRPIVGAREFLHRIERWCLWFVGVEPSAISRFPDLIERIDKVRVARLESEREETVALAATPALFGEIRQPAEAYLLIPEASSELRNYIPMAMQSPEVICSNLAKMVPNANVFHFGVLTSGMHMAWVDVVAGRLKSDYRYSNRLVYNNYPWPQDATPVQRTKVEELAQAVLDARALYPDSTLAQLYDPLLMPAELVHAHQRLDRAVERCYRPEPFASDRERVEFLFALYEQLTAPLLPVPQQSRRRRIRRT